MFKYLSLFLLSFIFLSACSANKQASNNISLTKQASLLKTSDSCLKSGGTWEKVGKLQFETCILKTSDAGKICSDNKDCQVSCLSKEKGLEIGSKAFGQCSSSTYEFGCRTYIKNAKVEPTLCID